MSQNTSGRLSKAQRREQLLDTAMGIVAERGADALTIGSLAEFAGLSKPVIYEHFGDRPGLLVALYRRIDKRQVDVLVGALERAPRRLTAVAQVMSRAYMSCYAASGPEWHAVAAALQGAEHMAAVQQELLDGYVANYCQALAPFSSLPTKQLHLRCGRAGSADSQSDPDKAAEALQRWSASRPSGGVVSGCALGLRPSHFTLPC